jgi:hypothetical protein
MGNYIPLRGTMLLYLILVVTLQRPNGEASERKEIDQLKAKITRQKSVKVAKA